NLAQVGEKTGTPRAIRTGAFFGIDEGQKFVAGNAIGAGGPIAPTVRWFNGRTEFLAGQFGLSLALEFQIVQELEEHDPGEQRQPVEVAVQALVLAHDVARGLNETAKLLSCGQWRTCFGGSRTSQSSSPLRC